MIETPRRERGTKDTRYANKKYIQYISRELNDQIHSQKIDSAFRAYPKNR
jgi:hypothetical protein